MREIDTMEDCLYNIHYIVTALDTQLKKYFEDHGEAVILSRYISYDFLPMRYDTKSMKFDHEDQKRIQAIVNSFTRDSSYVTLEDIETHLEDDFQILSRSVKRLEQYYNREILEHEAEQSVHKQSDLKMQLIMSGIAGLNLLSLIAICTPNPSGESNRSMLLHNIAKYLGPVATLGMMFWIK